jgi:bifunctional UDP-N-acetylglucosamine pyrophosphorylase / glucosamine-1-phosphate N-acetyltransferase
MADPRPVGATTPAGGRRCLAVVLAAGEGTRMRSSLPKVLHSVGGRSLLGHALAAVRAVGAGAVTVVIGPGREDVARAALAIEPAAVIVEQTERRGTAHAVLAAEASLAGDWDDVVIAFADTPLVTPATFARLRAPLAQGAAVVALGFEAVDPNGYGRLLTDAAGHLVAIREHKDASEAERGVRLCNAGLMALDGRHALTLLRSIGNANAAGEFYLTDAVEVARREGLRAAVVTAPEAEVMGINDRVQLAAAEALFQQARRVAHMREGVTLVAPETVFFSHDTILAADVLVEPNVVFGPGVRVDSGAVIHAFSHLEGARVGPGANVGPFARLRPGADLGADAKVGNFVEVKNAAIGDGAKLSHLTYVGDATVGPRANLGAGTVTCNYDGFGKYRTTIGEDAFVGSNSSLVAPVTIGDRAFVGSGSVVTEDVPADGLGVARGRQVNKIGWAVGFRERARAAKAEAKARAVAAKLEPKSS